MKRIEVLGTGCAKCKNLHAAVTRVVADLGLQAEVVKVEDIGAIVARGVMMTPGLVVDGNIVCTGKVPSTVELTTMLTTILASEET